MIRILGIFLLFCLGIGAASLWAGQMHHLRCAVPDQLPEWSAVIANSAALRSGEAKLPAQGAMPALRLSWQAKSPDLAGLNWDLRLAGQGIDLTAELTVSYWPETAKIHGGAGKVDLSSLPAAGIADDLKGIVTLQSVDLEILSLMRNPVPIGEFAASMTNLSVATAALGQGPVTATLTEDGAWRADLALDGGVSAGSASVTGQLNAGIGQLDVMIADVAALPELARRALEPLGNADGGGLRVSLPVPLR